ncbi:TPA: pilus assembly protein, partial [Escherichia coli]|nr:pilus assembly protein [Escherichia coli]
FQSCGVNWNCLGSYNAGFRSTMNQRREDYADNIYAIYRKLNRERRNMALR